MLEERFYKHLSISLIGVIIWMAYIFFNYYFEDKGFMNGFGLLINFMGSSIIAQISGLIMILLKYIISKKNIKNQIIEYLYLQFGLFNFFILLFFIVSLLLKILSFELEFFLSYFTGNIIVLLIVLKKYLNSRNFKLMVL